MASCESFDHVLFNKDVMTNVNVNVIFLFLCHFVLAGGFCLAMETSASSKGFRRKWRRLSDSSPVAVASDVCQVADISSASGPFAVFDIAVQPEANDQCTECASEPLDSADLSECAQHIESEDDCEPSLLNAHCYGACFRCWWSQFF